MSSKNNSQSPAVAPDKVQTKHKLNFCVPLLNIDGVPQQEIRPSFKGTYADLTDDDYVISMLNKILGRALAGSNEDFDGKEFEWYSVLYNTGVLELDATDTRRLKQFVVSKRKGEGAFSNIVVKQLFDVFKRANFAE